MTQKVFRIFIVVHWIPQFFSRKVGKATKTFLPLFKKYFRVLWFWMSLVCSEMKCYLLKNTGVACRCQLKVDTLQYATQAVFLWKIHLFWLCWTHHELLKYWLSITSTFKKLQICSHYYHNCWSKVSVKKIIGIYIQHILERFIQLYRCAFRSKLWGKWVNYFLKVLDNTWEGVIS